MYWNEILMNPNVFFNEKFYEGAYNVWKEDIFRSKKILPRLIISIPNKII